MAAAPLIDPELAAFLESGISMHVAAVGPDNVPHIARAAGMRIAANRGRVTIYLVESQARELLAHVRSNGAVAVAFTKPRSHRTVQLKGVDARVTRVRSQDAAHVDRQVAGLDAELRSIGFPERFGWTLAGGSPLGLAAVTFTPTRAYVQTPGPSAGTELKA